MDIHPTTTAGDGKQKIQRTQMRGDPVKRIIACAQCGYSFIEDRDREERSETDGNELVTTAVTINNVQSNLPIHLQGVSSFAAASKNIVEPNVIDGCPLCGTYNPRGEGRYPEFSNVDLSNQ